jgi:hypothetical protein
VKRRTIIGSRCCLSSADLKATAVCLLVDVDPSNPSSVRTGTTVQLFCVTGCAAVHTWFYRYIKRVYNCVINSS